MSVKPLNFILVSALLASPLIIGEMAVGSVRRPAAIEAPVVAAPTPKSAPKANAQSTRKPGSFLTRLKAGWARFRPVTNDHARLNQPSQLDLRTIDKIYDRDMSERLESRYQGHVLPLEKEVFNPYRFAAPWQRERYEQSRKDLAEWTIKEVGKDQLKDFVQRTKGESAAVGVLAATSGVNTSTASTKGGSGGSEAKAKTSSEKASHRIDVPASTFEEEEPPIPTRLRAKLNIIKTRGQLTFTNPVVTTSVEAQAGHGDNLSVEMNRDFRKLSMRSRVRYGVDQSLLNMNLNKQITDEVSVDLSSERWTGSKRGASGEKRKSTAQMLYSISF